MAKGYKGNPPECPPWTWIGDLEAEGIHWGVFMQTTSVVRLKVVARESVEKKANYWLAWTGRKFINADDSRSLEAHRPELHRALVDHLEVFL